MNIIIEIYWITVLMGALSAILRMKSSKELAPFKAMRDVQEQIDSFSDKWAERASNLFDWMFDNAPFSLFIVIATISIIPIINLMYFWANIKGLVVENNG